MGEVLGALTAQYPDLRKQIFTDEGKLRSFVNVYLNDEDIRYLSKDATPAADGDTISLVPSHRGRLHRRGAAGRRSTLSKDEILRYSRHLIMPGSRHGRAEEAQGREGAAGRHRRTGRAAGPVPGRGGRRHASAWWISTWWISPTCSAR